MTTKNTDKFFDLRTRERYLNSGEITKKDVDAYLKELPNDEENFDLVMIEEDDIGLGETLSEEELDAMPNMTEENIDNFDFLDEEDNTESEGQDSIDDSEDKT